MRDFGPAFAVMDAERTLLDNKGFQGQMIKWYASLKLPGLLYISSCTLFSYFFRKVPFLKRYEKLGTRLDWAIYDLFEITDNRVEIYKGEKQALEELYENGVKLFVTTRGTKSKTEKKLREFGILQLFELVLGAKRIPKSKHIASFASHMGIPLGEFVRRCFYLGDGVYDMYLAKRYKIPEIIGITNTLKAKILIEAGAKKVINNWGELLKVLK